MDEWAMRGRRHRLHRNHVYFLLLVAAVGLFGSCVGPVHRVYSTTPPGVTDVYAYNTVIFPSGMAVGKDGAIWVSDAEAGDSQVHRFKLDGSLRDFDLPRVDGGAEGIAAAPDGSMWMSMAVGGYPDPEGVNLLVRIPSSGRQRVYHIPNIRGSLGGVVVDRGGNVWFAESEAGMIGVRFANGAFNHYRLDNPKGYPMELALGDDGSIWFIEEIGIVGRIDPERRIYEYPIPSASPSLRRPVIATDTRGSAWFGGSDFDSIGQINSKGRMNIYRLPLVGGIHGITEGPDGLMWFTYENGFGRIDQTGRVTKYPTPVGDPEQIVTGPDKNLWFVTGQPGDTGAGDWAGVGKFALR